MTGRVLMAALFSMGVTLLAVPGAIRLLRRLGAGKHIREEGPAHHAAKAGTPTMGGAVMVVAAAAATLALSPRLEVGLGLAAALLAFGLLGSLDDLRALRRRRAMGMRAREKFLGQVLLAVAAVAWLRETAAAPPRWVVPFSPAEWAPPPAAAAAVSVLAVVGSANAVNLTDGLDGLAAGSVAVASAAYVGIAWLLNRPETAVFAAAVAGACLGFIWYNGYPAQVFMGDTGSLALGAALALFALTTGTLLVLPVVGGLFVAETGSVMAQVAYFKLTGGRRLLRMSPLHHHLELSGWPESRVVTRLWLTAAVLAAFGLMAVAHAKG